MKKSKVSGPKSKVLRWIIASAVLALDSRLQTPDCLADLSAVVTPGYKFASGERADTSKLNRLGNPTITITGTVGGTNANVANNSINGAMLVAGFPGSNLTWDANSPRRLVITNQAIGTNQINGEIAGLGLGSSSGWLGVNVDTNTIQITNDVVTLNLTTYSNLFSALLAQNLSNYFATNTIVIEFDLPNAGTAITNTHTLGHIPAMVRWVLKCNTNDIGYVAGDEVELASAGYWSAGDTPAFSAWFNSTNCGVARNDQSPVVQLFDRVGTASEATLTESRWKLKAYARP